MINAPNYETKIIGRPACLRESDYLSSLRAKPNEKKTAILLPFDIRSATTVNIFKTKLKTHPFCHVFLS